MTRSAVRRIADICRRAVIASFLALPLAVTAAHAATPQEQFITDNAQKALDILNNKSLSQTQRTDQFAQLLTGLTDMPRVAKGTLGIYARNASPQDLNAFTATFQDYVLSVYRLHINDMMVYNSGWSLKVVRSQARKPDDVVVNTLLNNSAAANDKRFPLEVGFRVAGTPGNFRLIDMSVGGLFLAFAQIEEFTSVLAQNNGSIPALIANLKTKTASMK